MSPEKGISLTVESNVKNKSDILNLIDILAVNTVLDKNI